MPGWPCAGVDAGFAAAGPGRRAEVTGEPPGRRLGLQVARHPGDKDARGQAHGERQDAVSQAGNDQGLAPLQAIAPGLGRRGRRRSRPAGTAACPPCRPAPRGRCPWHPGPGRTPALPSRGPPRPGLGERQYACFRRAVSGLVRAGLESGCGGDMQDRPAAPLQHPGQEQGGQRRQRRHVNLDHLQLPGGGRSPGVRWRAHRRSDPRGSNADRHRVKS